jgi:hypothetical protein
MQIPVHVRILRFESAGKLADETEGYFLSFAAASPAAFQAAVQAVRTLPAWQRVWLPGAQLWWVHEDGLSLLARRLPNLQARMWQAVYERAQGEGSAQTRRLLWQLAPRHVVDAFAVLSLRCDATSDQVKSAYRALAKKVHPDRGGSHSAMLSLNRAYTCALEWAESIHASANQERATAAAR